MGTSSPIRATCFRLPICGRQQGPIKTGSLQSGFISPTRNGSSKQFSVFKPENSWFIEKKKGKGGGTWAHWQVGMAYAKYLDPNFHMWCNTQVRAVMEGKVAAAIPDDVLELIRRTDGIAKMLAHKVTEIEKAMPIIAGQMADAMITAKLAERNLLLRHGVTAKRMWD